MKCGLKIHQVSVKGSLLEYDTLMCHCSSCKRRSGGLASYAFVIPDGKRNVDITGESHVSHNDNDTASGKPMQRSMCSHCGSPVRIIEGSAPDTWCMQYGLFADEVDLPPPRLEMFRSKACAWETQVGEQIMETQ